MEFENITYGEDFFDNTPLSSIYCQIAEEMDDEFDMREEEEMVYKYFEECLSDEVRLAPTKNFIRKPDMFNSAFVCVLKHCKEKGFIKISSIFIFFCEYFNIPYGVAYKLLNDRIRQIILSKFIDYIGSDEYQRLKKEITGEDNIQYTLFELFGKKR